MLPWKAPNDPKTIPISNISSISASAASPHQQLQRFCSISYMMMIYIQLIHIFSAGKRCTDRQTDRGGTRGPRGPKNPNLSDAMNSLSTEPSSTQELWSMPGKPEGQFKLKINKQDSMTMNILSTKSSPSTGILVFVQPEPDIDLGLQILQRHPGRNLRGERVQFLLWYRATLSLLCKLSLFSQSKFSFHLVFFPSFFPSNFLLEILNFLSF